MIRCILGGIAYVQKSLENLEDVESSLLDHRSGEGRVLEGWKDVVCSTEGSVLAGNGSGYSCSRDRISKCFSSGVLDGISLVPVLLECQGVNDSP